MRVSTIVFALSGFLGTAATAGEFVGVPTVQEVSWINRHTDLLRSRLKDGDSAQFRNLFVSRSGGSPIVCGEVNAKNSFGAYGGFERWLGAEPVGVFVESDVADDFGPLWAKFCSR